MRWLIWLRHCITSRKVTGSIPGSVTGIFIDSVCNRNECKEYFMGVKAAAQGLVYYSIEHISLVEKLGHISVVGRSLHCPGTRIGRLLPWCPCNFE